MTRHEDLLEEYAEELADAKAAAEAWWGRLHLANAARAGDAEVAREQLRRRWPDGPASHPLVLRVIRKYWLACEALNQGAPSIEPREPSERRHELDATLTETGDEVGGGGNDDNGDNDDDHEDDQEDDEVYPHVFIHEWLAGDHDELFEFLTPLSYWPIGLDAHDNFT